MNYSNTFTNQSHPAGKDEQPPSTLWVVMVSAVFVMFTVPYTTNFIPWAYDAGVFPLRPAIYLLIATTGCVVCSLGRRPDFTLATVVVFLFHALYLFDAAALQRFDHPSGSSYPTMTHGAVLLTIVAMAWFLGSVHRFTRIPVIASSALTVVICSLANIAEWFGVHDFSIVMGRAAGFWGDPNNSSIAIILALAVFLTLNKNVWYCLALIGLSFVAVAITLSRSGIIAEVMMTLSYLVIAYRKNPGTLSKAMAITVPLVFAAIVFLVSHMSSSVLRESDIQDRMGALLGKDSGKMASGERMKDLADGLQAARLQPITGYGVGAGTDKWQPHNQLIAIWLDGGIVLAVLFLIILGLLAAKCFSARGRGILCLLAVFIFIPFSQILHTHMGYWMTVILVINLTSTRFFSVQWFQPEPAALPSCHNSSV